MGQVTYRIMNMPVVRGTFTRGTLVITPAVPVHLLLQWLEIYKGENEVKNQTNPSSQLGTAVGVGSFHFPNESQMLNNVVRG